MLAFGRPVQAHHANRRKEASNKQHKKRFCLAVCAQFSDDGQLLLHHGCRSDEKSCRTGAERRVERAVVGPVPKLVDRPQSNVTLPLEVDQGSVGQGENYRIKLNKNVISR